jgi:CRP-like cAMP-binding protein
MTPPINPTTLSRFRAFTGLGETEIAAIIQRSGTEAFPAGAAIIREGDEGYCMHVLLAGSARVEASGAVLATLEPGDFFGEVSLVDDGPRSADVFAVSDCQTLTITRMTLGILSASHPDAAIHILGAVGRSLVGKLRRDNARLRELLLLGCEPQS